MTTLAPPSRSSNAIHFSSNVADPRVRIPALPSRLERVFAYLGVILFTVGVPVDWFVVHAADGDVPDSAQSSGPLASIVFLALAAGALLVLLPNIEALFRMLERNKTLVFIHGWILASTLWSVDSPTTFRRAMGLNATLLFASYLALRFDRRDLLRIAAAGGAVTVWLCFIWVIALPVYGISGENWSGIYANKNTLGQMATYAATLLLLESARRSWTQLWTIPSIAVALTILVGSDSKTALATAILLSALLIVFQVFRARKTLYGAVAVSMAAATVAAVLFAIAALPFIADLLQKDVTLTGRTDIWRQLLKTIWNRPIAGYGYEAFWNGWRSPAREVWLAGDWTPVHAHNAGFQYMLDQGIVGLGLILMFFFRSVVKATKLIGLQPGAAATVPIALLSFMLLSSITEDGILGRTAPWLMICAFMAGANCEDGLMLKRRASTNVNQQVRPTP